VGDTTKHPWAGLAAPWPRIAEADLGQRRVDLGGQLLTQTLVRPLMVVVPPESVAQRLALVDGVGRVGVEVLEGAVVALEVAAGLRVRRP